MRFKRITSLLLAIITIISMLPLVSCSTAEKNNADLTKSQDQQSPSQVEQSETVEQLEQGEKAEEVMPSAGTDEAVSAKPLAEVDTVEILQGDELIGIFQYAFDACASMRERVDTIKPELNIIASEVPAGKCLPDDYVEQYKAWRPVEQSESNDEAVQTQPSTPAPQPQQSQQPQQTPPQQQTQIEQPTNNQPEEPPSQTTSTSVENPYEFVPPQYSSEEELQKDLEIANQITEDLGISIYGG